jgi:hypothetical protein
VPNSQGDGVPVGSAGKAVLAGRQSWLILTTDHQSVSTSSRETATAFRKPTAVRSRSSQAMLCGAGEWDRLRCRRCVRSPYAGSVASGFRLCAPGRAGR